MNKQELLKTVKFTLFSISAGVIQLLSFALFNDVIRMGWWPSYLISLILSVLWNFTLNRKFTFQSAANVPIAMFKVACFYAVFTPLTGWLENFYTETLGWNEYLATGLNMALNLVTEFLYQRWFVFGKSIDTAKKEPRE